MNRLTVDNMALHETKTSQNMNKTNPAGIVTYQPMGLDNAAKRETPELTDSQIKQINKDKVKQYLNILDTDVYNQQKIKKEKPFQKPQLKRTMVKSFSPSKGDLSDTIFIDGFDTM